MEIYIDFVVNSCYNLRSSVRVGEYDTSSDPDCASTGFCAPRSVNHAISHVIVHPDYKQGQYHHDIALLVLKTPLNYSGKYFLLSIVMIIKLSIVPEMGVMIKTNI